MRAFTANGLQTLCDIYSEHLGQPEKGLPYALECIERSPHYANAHFSAGKAYFLMKRYDEAREMYQHAIEDGAYTDRQYVVDDEVPVWKAQCEIGSTYAEQGDHAKAAAWFEKGLANRPKIQPLRLNYANALEKLGRLAEAERIFRSVYADFGDEQSIVSLINYLLRHQSEREAIDLIERHYADVSVPAAVAMLLAAAAVAQGRKWGDGERYLRQAEQLQPDSPEVRNAIAALESSRSNSGVLASVQGAFAQQRFDDAIALAETGLSAAPGDAQLAYYAALACANLQRKDEALAYLNRITDAFAGEGADMLRATLLRELGRTSEALQALERVVSHNASNVDAVLMKSSLLESAGRIDEAERALLGVLPMGRQRVGVELAGLYLRGGRIEEAKRIAEQALT
ncbi:MAG TPA: tetratricopeptide repeat protein, partial [Candidatus Baltobacteraceae bacterium]